MAPSCSSMPVKRSSTRRSASGSPASRRDVESARAAVEAAARRRGRSSSPRWRRPRRRWCRPRRRRHVGHPSRLRSLLSLRGVGVALSSLAGAGVWKKQLSRPSVPASRAPRGRRGAPRRCRPEPTPQGGRGAFRPLRCSRRAMRSSTSAAHQVRCPSAAPGSRRANAAGSPRLRVERARAAAGPPPAAGVVAGHGRGGVAASSRRGWRRCRPQPRYPSILHVLVSPLGLLPSLPCPRLERALHLLGVRQQRPHGSAVIGSPMRRKPANFFIVRA